MFSPHSQVYFYLPVPIAPVRGETPEICHIKFVSSRSQHEQDSVLVLIKVKLLQGTWSSGPYQGKTQQNTVMKQKREKAAMLHKYLIKKTPVVML